MSRTSERQPAARQQRAPLIEKAAPSRLSTTATIVRDGPASAGRPPEILVVPRSNEPGEELADLWNLPAVSQRVDEMAPEDLQRLGREKLALGTVGELLAQGRQERSS